MKIVERWFLVAAATSFLALIATVALLEFMPN
jgi:hypothetical protein